jgi:hypothetical protein
MGRVEEEVRRKEQKEQKEQKELKIKGKRKRELISINILRIRDKHKRI